MLTMMGPGVLSAITVMSVSSSSVIHFFLSTQGQIAAVGSIVSAGYGFICGAYMPIATFGEGLQKVVSFLPGTYGTALVRNHAMRGAFAELAEEGVPRDVIKAGADRLGWTLDELLDKTILAMRSCEASINEEMAALGL